MKSAFVFAGAVALVAAGALSAPAVAHHSFAAEFDAKKPVVVDGVITKVQLVNPHSWIYVDVKDASGKVTNWGFEFGSPIGLRSAGITRADVKPGTKVRIAGYRAKNGGPFGYTSVIRLPDQRTVTVGAAVPPPKID
ncbi:hypothetical protein H0274_14110 [Altererythrobacter sp. CC-YST694]|uniref:DUF6152 family protein n=1 Tax=Altererythrobacter sp. CC-YST694 TaxID=2755038 RepID=UPI001D014536|nr:DUF6152 family protein [Altererythrobacter sp. CC-YST694]MCB5426395.1 hypothetical protein [Altererythrobacter sp. CC-YST694]